MYCYRLMTWLLLHCQAHISSLTWWFPLFKSVQILPSISTWPKSKCTEWCSSVFRIRTRPLLSSLASRSLIQLSNPTMVRRVHSVCSGQPEPRLRDARSKGRGSPIQPARLACLARPGWLAFHPEIITAMGHRRSSLNAKLASVLLSKYFSIIFPKKARAKHSL